MTLLSDDYGKLYIVQVLLRTNSYDIEEFLSHVHNRNGSLQTTDTIVLASIAALRPSQ